MSGAETGAAILFDPQGLSSAQCYGEACVGCHKKWPRPRTRVGRLPDGYPVLACDDCAPALLRPVAEPASGQQVTLVAHN